jgi:hypothetical protein
MNNLKGDLIIRDDAFHIEFLVRLVKAVNQTSENNFIKIIDQSNSNENLIDKNKPADPNEYLLV